MADGISAKTDPAGVSQPGGARAGRRTNADRSATTRRQILEATIRCLHETGYNSVTNSVVAETAGVSRGAMMHHFPTRQALLVATAEYVNDKTRAYRSKRLESFEPGLERFKALIDLAWETARMPENLALNEIRIGSRSDATIAEAITPTMTRVADEYGRFLGKVVRQAGLEPDKEMQGLLATVAMAMRAMAINHFTHPSPVMVENVLSSLRAHRDIIIARQLGPSAQLLALKAEQRKQKSPADDPNSARRASS